MDVSKGPKVQFILNLFSRRLTFLTEIIWGYDLVQNDRNILKNEYAHLWKLSYRHTH